MGNKRPTQAYLEKFTRLAISLLQIAVVITSVPRFTRDEIDETSNNTEGDRFISSRSLKEIVLKETSKW
jgi:hypothetical protein